MKIALAQINPIVGDFDYNLNKILLNIDLANKQNADVVIFPELSLCGYPPKDLLLKKQFTLDNKKYLNILEETAKQEIVIIVGFAEENKGKGKPLFNSLAIIQAAKIIQTRQKVLLPTYDVFDEDRYFEPGENVSPVKLFDRQIGLSICEDIWHNSSQWARPRYQCDPIQKLAKQKIEFLVNSSSSPYFIGKPSLRENILRKTAKKYKIPIVYVNQVGGNDELVFDGNSCVVDKDGNICLRLKAFQEELQTFEINDLRRIITSSDMLLSLLSDEDELLEAVICGLRDYVSKCGFKKVIIGLSGGIDSALTACIATFALGKKNVLGVSMPSRYTSCASLTDAKDLASNLGIELKTISIEEPFKAFLNLLLPLWNEADSSLAKENIQSRIRGTILMALSNQSGALVLSTGNKSELAVGYCTLYGDMCGGLAVISDLPKTVVYKLARYINQKYKPLKSAVKSLIPENIITKAPTAELKPNQTDQDTLPPYDVLDKVLNAYVEEHLPLADIIKGGVPKETALEICNMIDKSEYKREQAAPCLKLTSRSFGHGWRMPIAQRYKESI